MPSTSPLHLYKPYGPFSFPQPVRRCCPLPGLPPMPVPPSPPRWPETPWNRCGSTRQLGNGDYPGMTDRRRRSWTSSQCSCQRGEAMPTTHSAPNSYHHRQQQVSMLLHVTSQWLSDLHSTRCSPSATHPLQPPQRKTHHLKKAQRDNVPHTYGSRSVCSIFLLLSGLHQLPQPPEPASQCRCHGGTALAAR